MQHDVAIYTTAATTAGSYDRERGREDGAERQMVLLARGPRGVLVMIAVADDHRLPELDAFMPLRPEARNSYPPPRELEAG